MNKKITKHFYTEHTLRDFLLPVTLSLMLTFFLIWIVVVSLNTEQIAYTPQQTVTTNQMEGGDNS